jgi:hypothetical protein
MFRDRGPRGGFSRNGRILCHRRLRWDPDHWKRREQQWNRREQQWNRRDQQWNRRDQQWNRREQ